MVRGVVITLQAMQGKTKNVMIGGRHIKTMQENEEGKTVDVLTAGRLTLKDMTKITKNKINQMIPSQPTVNEQGNKVLKPLDNRSSIFESQGEKILRPLYDIKEESFIFEHSSLLHDTIDESLLKPLKTSKILNPLFDLNLNKNKDYCKLENTTVLSQSLDNPLLAPLKAPKSYGTYSKQQQEEVIAFIKDGNSLRTAEKVFGIPKSTMHCWLKKISNSDSLTSTTVEQFSDLNIDTNFSYSSADVSDCPVPKVKSYKDQLQRKNSPPASQIVIEELELIRFLLSNEGVEMIAKAYNITVREFLEFIQHVKSKTSDGLKGLLLTTDSNECRNTMNHYSAFYSQQKRRQSRAVDIGFAAPKKSLEVKENISNFPPLSPNSARKRMLQNENVSSTGNRTCLPVPVLQKRIKVEDNIYENNINNIKTEQRPSKNSYVAALLTKNSYKDEPDSRVQAPTKLVLTTKQFLAASKIISGVQPNLVNTFLSTKPLALTPDMVVSPITIPTTSFICNNLNAQSMDTSPDHTVIHDPAEITLRYSKVTNPVSIKAERLETEITLPSDISPRPGVTTSFPCTTLNSTVSSITRPTVSSNNSATLNLNEINRTQSERELMALVDGDNVSADQLCFEFRETLELSNWVDNENWYVDQYLQHFQVSPAITSPSSGVGEDDDNSSLSSDEGDNVEGLTFAADRNLEKSPYLERKNISKNVPITIFGSPKTSSELWPLERTSPSHETRLEQNAVIDLDGSVDSGLCSPSYQSAFFKPNSGLDKTKSAFAV